MPDTDDLSEQEFRDIAHLEELRRSIWSPDDSAAVMVGAGFSRNARPTGQGTPPFPLWKELIPALWNGLHRKSPPPDWVDVLRLSHEYVCTHGREALVRLFKKEIPYEHYAPGPLHERLLSMDWEDVFTTNYDLLLEDAARSISDKRRYDVVKTKSDIATTNKPRIVKLHGSFPSLDPAIITSEDYRTYPVDHPAFVNFVRQSLMEHRFCLIGFS